MSVEKDVDFFLVLRYKLNCEELLLSGPVGYTQLLFEIIYAASQVNKDNILLMGDFNCNGINCEDIDDRFWFWFWFVNQQDSLTNMFADVIGVV